MNDEVIEVVEWLARHEELRVVLHKVGTVLFDLKAFPGSSAVVDRVTVLLVVSVGTNDLSCLSCIGGLMALLTLGFALIVRFLVDEVFPVGEVGLDFCLRWDSALHPWVSVDFVDLRPLSWVKGHHLLEEILELGRVDIFSGLGLSVSLPEEFSTTCGD